MADTDRLRDLLVIVRDLDAIGPLWEAVTGAPAALHEIAGTREWHAAIAGLRVIVREAPDAAAHGLHAAVFREGARLVVRADDAAVTAETSPPTARRRAPRAAAPRAARPERKSPDTSRSPAETSARAPRRIVRPRGRVHKGGKK